MGNNLTFTEEHRSNDISLTRKPEDILDTFSDQELINIATSLARDPYPSYSDYEYFDEVNSILTKRGYHQVSRLDYEKNEEDEESDESDESDDTKQSVLSQPKAT